MIKKLFAIAFVSVLALALVGCQSNIPNGLERDVYDNGVAAYEMCQDYQDGKISESDLADGLLSIEGKMGDAIDDNSDGENAKLVARVAQIWNDIEIDKNTQNIDQHIQELGESLGKE